MQNGGKEDQGMYQKVCGTCKVIFLLIIKIVCCTCKVFFLLIRSIAVVFLPFSFSVTKFGLEVLTGKALSF